MIFKRLLEWLLHHHCCSNFTAKLSRVGCDWSPLNPFTVPGCHV